MWCELIDKAAIQYSDKHIFKSEQGGETFSSFRDKSFKIATLLSRSGYYRAPILIVAGKNAKCLAAMFGVASSGNFYSLIDITSPDVRLQKIVDVLQPSVILVEEGCITKLGALSYASKVLVYEEAMNVSVDIELLRHISSRIIDTDVLYVFFTSGSTGIPKGVVVPHRLVLNYMNWFIRRFKIDESIIFGNQAPFYFDASLPDVFVPVLTGATTNIIPSHLFAFPMDLLSYLRNNGINTIKWIASALVLVANMKALESTLVLPGLEKILFSGEAMPTKQLNVWRKYFPDALFANMYGPTETSICTSYILDRAFSDDESIPIIGEICSDTSILVLTEDDNEVVGEEVGELCVRGTSLAHGYYKNPEKTAEVFVQNPLNNLYPERIYRTGDIVKYNERGELIYLTRKDFQIKRHGYRIELGEIEVATHAIKGVEVAVVLFNAENNSIVLLYKGDIAEDEITESLRRTISRYMLPDKYIKLNQIPYNRNGKIDKILLSEMIKDED